MSILDQTLLASYKGVPFLVDKADTEGGIKNVKHQFPNSSNQIIENLGTKQHSYKIQALITNDPELDDYKEKRDQFIAILDSGEKGVLIHPLFGRLDDIVATSWTLIEDFTSLGIGEFSITFEVDLTQSVPTIQGNNLSQVINSEEETSESLTEDLAEESEDNFFNNISDRIDQVNDLVDTFKEKTELFTIGADKLNAFSNQLSDLANNVVSLVRQPLALAQSIENLFNTTAGMFVTFEAAFGVIQEFFDFGDDDVDIQPNTVSRVERIQNRELLKESVQAYALTHAYTIASNIPFNTIPDQQKVADILEVQYDKVIANKVVVSEVGGVLPPNDPGRTSFLVGITNKSKSLITNQRITVEKLFEEDRSVSGIDRVEALNAFLTSGSSPRSLISSSPGSLLSSSLIPLGTTGSDTESLSTDAQGDSLSQANKVTLGRLVSISTPLTSARLLSYQYYGSSQLGEEIAVLNGLSDASFVEGDLEIITS